jgi:hypothetical protein
MEGEGAMVRRQIWDGIIEFETDDTPRDIQNFNAFGKSALLWLEQSKSLHYAAVALMSEVNRRTWFVNAPIALMLGGYATETLLKMVLVAQHEVRPFSQRAKDFLPTTHDLLKLATDAKLRANKGERETLKSLSRFTTWAGRYPIPLLANGYALPAIFENVGKGVVPHPLWLKYPALYKKLYRSAVRKTFGNLKRA